jgi:hypothetical protein
MKYKFKLTERENVNWESISSCYDYLPYKSKYWNSYLNNNFNVKEYVLEITDDENLIGFFIGVKIKKIFTIIAAPFEGLYTPFQGLTMLKEITIQQRIELYKSLKKFLFDSKECSFFQVCDWHLELPHVAHAEIPFEVHKGYLLDIRESAEVILSKMGSSARNPIKASKNRRLIIKEPDNFDSYARTYFEQLVDVFKKQNKKPTHSFDEIFNQITFLHQQDKIFALEILNEDGIPLASTFFIYEKDIAFWLGAASFSKYQKLSPNEPLMYQAIIGLKNIGINFIEMGGGRNYKEKYGPIPYVKPKIVFAKYRLLHQAKQLAKYLYYKINQ